MERLFYTVLQLTWGIVQTLAGAAVFLTQINRPHFIYRGCVATEWKNYTSASLGLFIFVSDKISGDYREETIKHEFGHTVQSIILGPLYLPVIALPSMLWCMLPVFVRLRERRGISYYSLYTERWANILGGVDKR